jgi:hypothetical protein
MSELNNCLTKSMEQFSSSEASSCPAAEEIPLLLCKTKGGGCNDERQPPVSVLSYMNPVHPITSYLFQARVNMISPPSPTVFKVAFFPFRFSNQNC